MSTSNTNPSTIFGGTWEAWGSGKVPVGVDTSDASFNTVEKTGGTKTIDLNHSHTVNSHKHQMCVQFKGAYTIGNGFSYVEGGSVPNIGVYTDVASPGTNTKLSTAQSILQPYITCYMWKRTA